MATFAIIFGHYQQFLGVSFEHVNFSAGVFPVGQSMVYLFFTISGLFMARYISLIANKEVDFKMFVGKRAMRLLPMMAFTAVVYELSIIAFRCLTGISWSQLMKEMGVDLVAGIDGFGMLATMTGTSAGWFYNGPMVNGVTWYVSVLLLCYIIFYCGCRLTIHFSISPIYVFVLMIIIGLSCWHYGARLPFLNVWAAKGYISFFVGVLIGKYMKLRDYTAKGLIPKLGFFGIIISVVYIVGVVYLQKDTKFQDHLWLMIITIPSLIFVFLTDTAKKMFRSPKWEILGAITFDVYMWHYILIILFRAFNTGLNLNLPYQSRWFMLVFSLWCFMFGTVSYFSLEGKLNKAIVSFIHKVYE